MPTLEERVAYLEGKTEDHSTVAADLRRTIRELRDEMIRRFEQADQKIDRHFTWLVGIQLGTLVAIVGALVGAYYR